MKITFLGGGNMANALIGGLRKQGYSAAGIQVVDPLEDARTRLTGAFGVRCCAAVDAASLNCEVLVLAVKPQQMKEALQPVAGQLRQQVVLSIAAGLRLADISRWLGGYSQLVRSMPNMPSLIGEGISGLYADPSVSGEGRDMAEKIVAAVGSSLWIEEEEKMDAVTAVSGSGPGYVFYFIEALQLAARALGFSDAEARILAIETFAGAAKLAESSPDPASLLRERVTSRGGTTEAALNSFNKDGVAAAILRGVRAAQARGRELGEQLGQD